MKKVISLITAFILVASIVTVSVPFAASAKDGLSLTGIYDSANYTVFGNNGYSMAFDNDGKTVTSSNNQVKAKLDYTSNMTAFDTSMVIKGNTAGTVYGGMGFHIQDSDFTNATFNSSGYMVVLKRTKDTATVTVMVRYMTAGASKKEINTALNDFVTATKKDVRLKLDVSVDDTNFSIKVTNADDTSKKSNVLTYPLNAESTYTGTKYYPSGAFAFITNGIHTYSDVSITSYGGVNASQLPVEKETLGSKYKLYGSTSTDDKNYTSTSSSIARGVLKDTTVADFSSEVTMKVSDTGDLKAGIIFRTGTVGAGTDDMEGYSAVLWKKTSTGADYNRLVLLVYKYGIVDGNYKYLGTIGSTSNSTVLGYFSDSLTAAAGQEITLHLNVVGNKAELYCYGKTNPNDKTAVRKSQVFAVDLTTVTDVEGKAGNEDILAAGIKYTKGGIGFYLSKGSLINATELKISAAEPLTGGESESEVYPGGRAAAKNSYGKAVSGAAASVTGAKHTCIIAPKVSDLEEYTKDFSNYTFYSSSTSNTFAVKNGEAVSDTAGTKRAILDDVTTLGFHSTVTMRISDEGTLKSGIVFRVNNINGSLAADGTLGANDIEGYAAVLYKTPGNTNDHGRVVLCLYKYGVAKGTHQYLGTIASKASSVPLQKYSKKIDSAAGQELTLVVNVIDDTVSAYFYNAKNPTLKSETLVADLNNATDIEGSTPSLKGVHYNSGAIGFTVTNYAAITDFTLSEPIYPSTAVGNLGDLDSYTIYGTSTGVTVNKDGYFEAESSGSKKMIVNNLTVTDFVASLDTVIDNNGNLKTGIIFRANNIGNGADAQEGYALTIVRNYATQGATNPNRLDLVVFKWGLQNGKQVYLGEVAREAYKSGASFMDGKMVGKEITLVVKVSGAALDATAYLKEDPTNKPVTFSTNLKFAADKEKENIAYYESGSIGLILSNTVSDPYTKNLVRNFNIDDGSGVKIMSTPAKRTGIAPITGYELFTVIVVAAVLCVVSGVVVITSFKKKSIISGRNIK